MASKPFETPGNTSRNRLPSVRPTLLFVGGGLVVLLVLLLTFLAGNDGDEDGDGITLKLGRPDPVGSEAEKPLRCEPLGLSIQFPTGWTVYEDVNGARMHAVAPVSGDVYSPNLRLVSSSVGDTVDTAAYWLENRAAVLSTLPACKMLKERRVKVGDLDVVEATLTYTGADAMDLTMNIWLFTRGGKGISVTGIAATEDAATWQDAFSQTTASLEFD